VDMSTKKELKQAGVDMATHKVAHARVDMSTSTKA